MFKKIKNFFPSKDEFFLIERSLSKKEWLLLLVLFFVGLFSFLNIFEDLNRSLSKINPAYGGTYTIGIVGTPRFINPVLAITDADKDLTELVYSGILRKDEKGGYINDLASSVEKSEDGKEYTVHLKKGVKFHDGEELTATDVSFTIESIQNPDVKSPLRIKWQGVSSEIVDDYTIVFKIKEPYSAFEDQLTLGILPYHLWKDLSPTEFSINDYNTSPIGTGPYKISSVEKKSSGIAISYSLVSNRDFALGRPYIDHILVKFYPNEQKAIDAIKGSSVDTISGISPANTYTFEDKSFVVESVPLPRVFGLFFNKNQNPLLGNDYIVKAIQMAIDKNEIIDSIFFGHATPISNPVPNTLYNPSDYVSEYDPEKAINLLVSKGWSIDETGFMSKTDKDNTTYLSLKIATSDTPELISVAEEIQRNLQKIGIAVEIQIFDIGTLNQDIIRPREFEALLFGEIIEHESDLFAFWHSSQRKDPGLNVTEYTVSAVDSLLEKMRSGTGDYDKEKTISSFISEYKKAPSAVFIYNPHLTIVHTKSIKNWVTTNIAESSDRLSTIYKANIYSEYLYSLFNK
ncbi:peptide ABC transporter substrate-binding protein [Candidatus Nomurabacteria bacterium]|nr:peptide ABC transporter substrate-binding protein [Candidatus Nomurabacteria bacterium]MCB9820571.1 peptide ABC transporter substrate-binding protein [Candidatus Nomurabacteria bacterium]